MQFRIPGGAKCVLIRLQLFPGDRVGAPDRAPRETKPERKKGKGEDEQTRREREADREKQEGDKIRAPEEAERTQKEQEDAAASATQFREDVNGVRHRILPDAGPTFAAGTETGEKEKLDQERIERAKKRAN